MLFIHPYKVMYKLNTLSAIKKMTVKELRDFIHKNYYKQIGFTKDNTCSSIKRQKKHLLSFATKLMKNT